MIIDENVKYNARLNDDEKEKIDSAVNVMNTIIMNMHNHKCNHASFRSGNSELPRSLARLVEMKEELKSIKSLESIYTHQEKTEWETNV